MTSKKILIGDVLKRAREKKGLKAEEVAALCNVTRGRYYQWEASDRILGKNIPPLAKALDLSAKYLKRINGRYDSRSHSREDEQQSHAAA